MKPKKFNKWVDSIFLTAIFHVLMIKTLGKKFNPFCEITYVITKYTAVKEIKTVS
jgi:hypothetical protein